MVKNYQGPYQYQKSIVDNWNSSAIGVYYCGEIASNGNLIVHYVGKGCGDGGIKCRLQDHLNEDSWPDVTHFGFCLCDYGSDADTHEMAEIRRLQPKYNTVGVL